MGFSEEMIQKVWEKGFTVPGFDPNIWRKDECTAFINRDQYGNRNSIYGWEIDHISPGGSDQLHNLRPLQWENNLAKSDGRLKCVVVSQANINIRK
jgi:hypothetical protein